MDEVTRHLTPVELKRSQVILEPGEEIRQVTFLANGLVSARVPFKSGHEVECVLLGSNTAIGAVSTLGMDSAVTRAVCLSDAHAWTVSVPVLRDLVQKHRDLEQAIKTSCGSQFSSAVLVGACNAMHGSKRRLARWLLLAHDLVNGAPLAIRQDDLGASLGLQRTVINPCLQQFQADGLISIGRGLLNVLDHDALRERACDCFLPLHRLTWALSPERAAGAARQT